MDIRAIEHHELDELLSLYSHLHTQDEPRPDRYVLEAVWAEALANQRIRYFGGFEQGRLLSSCNIAVIPNLTRGCRPYGVIENVVTDAAYRRQGRGSALLAHALAFAWSHRCYKVMLFTGRQEEATLRFYEKAGFDRHSKQAFIARPERPHQTARQER
ncbi:MAG: GNAT family N-acetyltransferase [Vicinamibacterales bacterium]